MAKRLKQSGQTLVEAVFVVGVIGLILSGLVASVVYSNRVARVSRDNSLAVKLAREKLEQLKSEKKNSSDTFWADAETNGTFPSSAEEITLQNINFERQWTFSNYTAFPNTRRTLATVTVGWNDNSASDTKTFVLSGYISDY